MACVFETKRLVIRTFEPSDAAFIVQLVNSPGWLQYIGDREVATEKQAITYLEDGPFKSYQLNGFGLWMVELKSGEIPVGMCGLLKRPHLEHPDLGFAFLLGYMGVGYALEASTAVMNYSWSELKLTVVLAVTMPDNAPSIKLLTKLGFKEVGPISFPDSSEELRSWSAAARA